MQIKKAEELLSNFLQEPIWLVRDKGKYIVQCVSDGNYQRYKHLYFKTLADVVEYIEFKKECNKQVFGE